MKSTLKLLIFSDIFLVTGFGLINPILAIFIKDNLVGGSLAAVGTASAIFLLVKSVLQIAVSEKFNPKDRKWLLITGTFLLAAVPFVYAYSTNIWHIYFAQVLQGAAAAMAMPTFMGLFILNTNKKHPGLEWSIYSTAVSLGTGIAAYTGAVLADKIGFQAVFFITAFMAIIASLILFKVDTNSKK